MKPSEDVKPVTYMKTHSAELIRQVTAGKRPMIITQNGRAKVVVQDVDSFERDRQALLLLKIISQGATDAEAGRFVEQEELFRRLERKLARKLS